MRRVRALWGILGVLVGLQPASAALEYEALALDSGGNIIVASGEIDHDEPIAAFVAAVREHDARSVVFDSPGGNPRSAMRLGRAIRALGLDTIQIREMECASACSLAFSGGVERHAAPGSIGVHRSSFAPDAPLDRDDAVAGVQEMTADILTYLIEMGVKPELLDFSLRYGQNDMRYLSASEMAELGVTTTDAPAATALSPGKTVSPPAPQAVVRPSPDLERSAIGVVRALIERDGNDAKASLWTVQTTYADQVHYYGKQTPLTEVLRDKRAYFARWPERAYRIREHTVSVSCGNTLCRVSGVYDWMVRSLPRNRQAQGAARFSYTISLGSDPKVIAEAGEVIRQ